MEAELFSRQAGKAPFPHGPASPLLQAGKGHGSPPLPFPAGGKKLGGGGIARCGGREISFAGDAKGSSSRGGGSSSSSGGGSSSSGTEAERGGADPPPDAATAFEASCPLQAVQEVTDDGDGVNTSGGGGMSDHPLPSFVEPSVSLTSASLTSVSLRSGSLSSGALGSGSLGSGLTASASRFQESSVRQMTHSSPRSYVFSSRTVCNHYVSIADVVCG